MTDLDYLDQIEKIVRHVSDNVLEKFFLQTTALLKTDGSIVTEADIAMQDSLTNALYEVSPETLMLGEEMDVNQQQQIINSGKPYWCLDPVDGTNNFYHGVPLFAVSLALIKDREIQIGLVYDPVRKEMFSAKKGLGLRVNGKRFQEPEQPTDLKQCLASVDFKRLNLDVKQQLIQTMPFKSQRNIGTCALEWAWLASGRIQLLLHGGEKFWDYAAGSLLVRESNGRSCTFGREPIFNNSLQARSVIAACNDELHQNWLSYLLD